MLTRRLLRETDNIKNHIRGSATHPTRPTSQINSFSPIGARYHNFLTRKHNCSRPRPDRKLDCLLVLLIIQHIVNRALQEHRRNRNSRLLLPRRKDASCCLLRLGAGPMVLSAPDAAALSSSRARVSLWHFSLPASNSRGQTSSDAKITSNVNTSTEARRSRPAEGLTEVMSPTCCSGDDMITRARSLRIFSNISTKNTRLSRIRTAFSAPTCWKQGPGAHHTGLRAITCADAEDLLASAREHDIRATDELPIVISVLLWCATAQPIPPLASNRSASQDTRKRFRVNLLA